MFRRTALALFSTWPLALADPAYAQAQATQVDISSGPLPQNLQQLQRQTGVELLFDPSTVTGHQSPEVRGVLTTEAALRQLLAGTNLTVRRAQSGAWIVEHANTLPLEQQDAEAPEIIVIGRRTQNADIRRFENDVQPYVVVTQEEIRAAHRDNIDQYFNSRITANTTVVPPSWAQDASTQSAIDLRGLGTQHTLVLVDGRRMPSAPFSLAFDQSDLNAIPLHAIKRIEVLTGAAGGIHGFGALGGVVNVVVDREHRGADFYITEGVSSRGDGRHQGIEASFGYTSDDGAADFTAFAASVESDALYIGERGFDIRDRRQTFAIDPRNYFGLLDTPHGNSITVMNWFGDDDLTFKPEFGGGELGSHFSFLPLRSEADLIATLIENAGQVDFSLPDEDRASDLGSNPRTEALLLNLRRRFGAGLEVFADAALLRSQGESRDRRETGEIILTPESPLNPFIDFVQLTFPVEHQGGSTIRQTIENVRYSAGVLTNLSFDWRGAAEASWGGFRIHRSTESSLSNLVALLILSGSASDPDINPFGDWDAFQEALSQDVRSTTGDIQLDTRFETQSVRLAGPLFGTPAGDATLTLLAEHRAETAPAHTIRQTVDNGDGPILTETPVAEVSTDTSSLYAELRAPMFDASAPIWLLRGLEVQLAIRRDEQENVFPHLAFDSNSSPVEVTFAELTYTAGLKVSPAPWLMLRASLATGRQPPRLESLQTIEDEIIDFGLTLDPRRDGVFVGDEGPVVFQSGGSPDLDTVQAETLFLGVVLTPFGEDGARFSLDYSRIRRTGDVVDFIWDDILAHEDYWPERVTRGPLTDADIALGYTGGPVTRIDMRSMNGGSLEVEALDMRAEWPLSFLGGRLRLYADATYHMRNTVQEIFSPEVERTDFFEGPLTWRANGGFEWSRDDFSIGANLQYFGSYSVLEQSVFVPVDEEMANVQGSRSIPSQIYLDIHARWQLPLRDHDIRLDLGVINVFDDQPPRETAFATPLRAPGYSRYGDPRQRRFELVLSSHF